MVTAQACSTAPLGREKVDEQELDELEDPASWDLDRAELHPGVQGGTATIIVPFDRQDYQQVAGAAARIGKKTTDFIREAALARTRASIRLPYDVWTEADTKHQPVQQDRQPPTGSGELLTPTNVSLALS
jgi:hypothetical protein